MNDFYIEVIPVVDLSVRALCKASYHNHPKGCPNWNKRSDCPPKCSSINDMIDLSRPVYAIYNRYDLGAHIERMRGKHPEWTNYQLRCVLYWQGTARKQLKDHIFAFKKKYPHLFIVKNPEAAGVNLTETMKKAGITLDWPPKRWAYQIVLAGHRKEK